MFKLNHPQWNKNKNSKTQSVLPWDFLHDIVGLGLPWAAQSMTAISLWTTVTSWGSISQRGGTEMKSHCLKQKYILSKCHLWQWAEQWSWQRLRHWWRDRCSCRCGPQPGWRTGCYWRRCCFGPEIWNNSGVNKSIKIISPEHQHQERRLGHPSSTGCLWACPRRRWCRRPETYLPPWGLRQM